jgi:hypothetical protein
MSEGNEAKYTVRICPPGGVRAGVEGIIASDNNLGPARKLFRAAADGNPHRLILLYQSDKIIARSDEPDTMP